MAAPASMTIVETTLTTNTGSPCTTGVPCHSRRTASTMTSTLTASSTAPLISATTVVARDRRPPARGDRSRSVTASRPRIRPTESAAKSPAAASTPNEWADTPVATRPTIIITFSAKTNPSRRR